MTADAAAALIRARIGEARPLVAIVLGSGLGEVADQIADPVVVPYADLPGFPRPTVSGHAGRLLVGELAGVPVACMQGRMHFYEGHDLAALALPVRTLARLGCQTLLLSNAAGSLRTEMGPGSMMLITDHINMVGVNPLIGPNDDSFGPRFFDVGAAYDPDLRARLLEVADERGLTLHQGVYAWFSGPNFETPAEVRAAGILGADAVGMSTVPECLVAVHAGMRVAALSVITNLAAGLSESPLSHDETLANATRAAVDFRDLVAGFVARLGSPA